MWDFLKALFETHGLVAVIQVAQTAAIFYLYKANQKRQDEIVALHEKRLVEAKESRDHYEILAENLDKSIDLLIKVFKQKNGD